MKQIGFTVGKFMPFHKGHELMVDLAADFFDEVVVIVAGKETDVIPLSARYEMVSESVSSNVTVVKFVDEIGDPILVDKHGTALDEAFWDSWISAFWNSVPADVTHFFSSDLYGKEVARRMKIQWLPIDPTRSIFDISGTQVRENPRRFFGMLSESAKKYYRNRIAIVGPESTGKSTLVKNLAAGFRTEYVPEYGRIYSENVELYSESDFDAIARMQANLTRELEKNAGFYFFADTEAYVTYLYQKLYIGTENPKLLDFARKQTFNLYLVMAPTTEFVQDGTRVMTEDQREQFHKELIQLLEEGNHKYKVIDSMNYSVREHEALQAIYGVLTNR